ncbi:MAG: Xaa-Pro dipeptidase [Smithella sp. PtaU1.Bin162]|nr:MAG: Xaa-Pro dipeptidase [Smithella sp. PtaU1.Bin162]
MSEFEAKAKQWDKFLAEFKNEYSPRHIYGTDAVDFEERVNFPRMRAYKLNRIRQAMKKRDIAVMLLNNGEQVRYATGSWDQDWKTTNNTRYALVFHDKDPILFETVGIDLHVTQLNCPWLAGRIYPAITYKFAAGGFEDVCNRYWDQIEQVCKENGVNIKKDKIGTELIEIPAYEIAKARGINLVSAGEVCVEARFVKSKDELEMMKLSVAMGDIGYWKLKNEICKPGIREREARGLLLAEMTRLGCAFSLGHIVASGGNTNPYKRATTDKLIRPGDMIICDLAINFFYGYVQDLCRSWVCGAKMTPKQKDVYKRCYAKLQKGLSQVKAGNTTGQLAKDGLNEYYDDKYGTCSLVEFAHTIGQGLYEGFWVSRGFSIEHPVVLEENMVMAVEVYEADPGDDFGVRLERNVIVTKNGYIPLDLFPFEEEAVGENVY